MSNQSRMCAFCTLICEPASCCICIYIYFHPQAPLLCLFWLLPETWALSPATLPDSARAIVVGLLVAGRIQLPVSSKKGRYVPGPQKYLKQWPHTFRNSPRALLCIRWGPGSGISRSPACHEGSGQITARSNKVTLNSSCCGEYTQKRLQFRARKM